MDYLEITEQKKLQSALWLETIEGQSTIINQENQLNGQIMLNNITFWCMSLWIYYTTVNLHL